jgi:hypothetical protein
MTNSVTSLDRLHDLALPPEVSWWPLAPGWCFVVFLVLALLLVFLHRTWKQWRANAYRRAALRELASAQDASAIAEILRRIALAVAPRAVVAEMTGAAWLDWLAEQYPEPLPDAVRSQLTRGVYGRSAASQELSALRDYATRWIARHHRPPIANRE